jgi:hypothetical protein
MERKIPTNLFTRAEVATSSYNEEERTVKVIFATSTPIARMDWEEWEMFDEVLDFEPSSMRLERLNSGAPILKDHYNSTDNVIGVVERAWIENGQGSAIIRISDTPDTELIRQKIKDKILRNVSVGYRVYKYERQPKADNQARSVYRAIDWEPYEISLVGVPADHKSTLRSSEGNHYVTIIEDEKMENEPKPPTPSVDVEAQKNEAVRIALEAERSRVAAITMLCRKALTPADFTEKLISENTPLDKARELIMEKMFEASPTRGLNNVKPQENQGQFTRLAGADEEDKRRDAQITALMLRSGALKDKDVEDKSVLAHAREFRNMSLVELAKDSLLRAGEADERALRSMSRMEIVGRAITSNTADFPVLLEGANRRTVLRDYAITADTWRRWCSIGSVSDFRDWTRLELGGLSNLEDLSENREYRNKKLHDGRIEKVNVSTKGNTINLSREMIVNDDLAGFLRLASDLGRAAARTIEAAVYNALKSNGGLGPLLSDGKTLFHADHNNLAAAAALSVDTLDKVRLLMSEQTDLNGYDKLDLNPSILLIDKGRGSQARLLNTAQYNPDVTGKFQLPNIVAGLFNDVVDTSRLTDAYFYLLADPSIAPTMEVTFLDGVEEPFMESRNGWSVDGIEWKIRMDFGVHAVGYKGAVAVPKP